MEDFETLKKEIYDRHAARVIECRDSRGLDVISRAQGAAVELSQLLGFIEQLENGPPKETQAAIGLDF